MNRAVVGQGVSQESGSEIYFQTYQHLLRQKNQIEKQILKLQSKFMKAVMSNKSVAPSKRAKYVPRLNNTTTLAQAIRESMSPNRKMTMEDIIKSLSKKKLYSTDSKYFYTMVNNKLNRDDNVHKVSRGVFVYSPKGRNKNIII